MRDDWLLPENPVPPPVNPARIRPVHPSTSEAAAMALRDCRVQLWRDLWQKVERLERENVVLRRKLARRRPRRLRDPES